MDYRLAAARRLMAIGAENPRARSIIDFNRPVYLMPPQGSLDVPDDLPGITSGQLASLAQDKAPLVALLEVEEGGQFHPVATAWPVSVGTAANPGRTRRFLTAGHVLRVVLEEGISVARAADVQRPSRKRRPARLVFPHDAGTAHPVTGWICSADLDLAVFEIGTECDALFLDLGAERPPCLAVIGYPLVAGVDVFRRKINPYAGQQFLVIGQTFESDQASTMAQTRFLHDATTLPGFSGAPIFDPATGHVIGLHIQGSRHGLEHSSHSAASGVTVQGDLNDGILASGAVGLHGWLEDILNGSSPAPPEDAESMGWSGGAAPRPIEPYEARFPAMLMADTGAYRDASIAGPEGGVVPDRPDKRDRFYEPGLSSPPLCFIPKEEPEPAVGHQGSEGACAAFALAGAIEIQLARRDGYRPPAQGLTASVRMLDRMARRHDEWLDDTPDGTSLRAVLKGFYHNGVCPESACAYVPRRPAFFLTRDIARKARDITLGAYLRVRLSADDMRMAIAESGAVIVTADVHAGWEKLDGEGRIPFKLSDPPRARGRHAFVVSGYDADGFIIQNALGRGWGGYRNLPGHALWTFEDWAQNCRDAWAIRLAPPGDKAFALAPEADGKAPTPRRLGLLGHAIHAERFGLVEDGTLGLGARGVAETAAYLDSKGARERYDRLMLVFHEPLMEGDVITRLALRLTLPLKARGIYPFHIVHGLDEMLACRLRLSHDVGRAVESYLREGTSRDAALQRQLGPVIRTQVDHFAQGARAAAASVLGDALGPLMLCAAPERRVDLVSVGLGGAVAQEMLDTWPKPRPLHLSHLAIACPLDIKPTQHWPLGKAMDEADLPGWLGSWGDIVAGAYGRSIRGPRGAKAANAQALLSLPDFVPDLLKRLDGQPGA